MSVCQQNCSNRYGQHMGSRHDDFIFIDCLNIFVKCRCWSYWASSISFNAYGLNFRSMYLKLYLLKDPSYAILKGHQCNCFMEALKVINMTACCVPIFLCYWFCSWSSKQLTFFSMTIWNVIAQNQVVSHYNVVEFFQNIHFNLLLMSYTPDHMQCLLWV